ncbi:MAG: hypothetical protein LIP16_20080 [Clostridium sp.]|nr:hypothetical protein [Clostridium sp.]
MRLFSRQGSRNTGETILLALQKAKEMESGLVAASTSGATALEILRQAEKIGFKRKITIVRTAASGVSGKGAAQMPDPVKADLERQGVVLVTAAHALSAGERGISARLGGYGPLELMAATLRTMGEGTKVCFECAVMALDAGALPYGMPVVAIGGTASGCDTAIVITPSYSASILNTRIHEFICKPELY